METCLCWGLDVGNGWYQIIDDLCAQIQGHIDANPHLMTKENVPIEERKKDAKLLVKGEYFNTRRYEYPLRQTECSQCKSKFGTLRFYVDGYNPYVDGLISYAEYLSGQTCETCGKPAQMCIRGGWYSTLCPECAKKEGFKKYVYKKRD